MSLSCTETSGFRNRRRFRFAVRPTELYEICGLLICRRHIVVYFTKFNISMGTGFNGVCVNAISIRLQELDWAASSCCQRSS